MPNKDKALLDEVNEYANLWNDSASWVTTSGAKVNISSNSQSKTKYKDKLQKLVDYHITDTTNHDAKAHGRWKPTANMNIKALDETADSVFLTFTETCYRGQAGTAEERMIDAFYSKQTKKFKILFFLDKKLTIRKEGAGFNDMMEELCFFFRSPKFGTPERQDLMEWVDQNGNKITTSSKATTATSTKQHPLHWPYANRFAKIIEYHMRHTPGTRTLKKDIMKYVFQYEEQKTNGIILDVIAGIDDKEDYHIKVFHDRTTVVDTFSGNGYEKFLEALAKYMTLPINKQDPDYKNLLVESALTEFVDTSGQSIILNSNNAATKTPTQKTSTTNNSIAAGSTKIYDLRDKYDKLVSHLRTMYSLNVNRRTAQLLDVDIKVGTKFKNKLIATYDYQKNCLVGTLYDEFGREISSNNCWGGWSVLIAWLKKEGFPLIDHLCENNSDKESCKFPFSKEDLDAALDNLTDEDEPGLELGDNFENSDVLTVAGEPYGGTKWYVDKWADNFYIITSELWGQDGGGPEEGVYEELDSIDEVWDYLNKLDPLSGVPALTNKKDFI